MGDKLVLVTGGSGFIGAHCILKLLGAGYRVRTTVRSLTREADVRAMLKVGGAAEIDRGQLTFVAADLTSDEGWTEAVQGIQYVLHVASPFPPSVPKHEDDLITPAREGTLRILRAAHQAGVKRIVLTSSFASCGYGPQAERKKTDGAPFDETDWTDPNGADVSAYAKSKTLAEKAAWDFIASEGKSMELAVVCPVGVFGPVLGKDYATSILLIQRFLDGTMPGCPRISFGIVDARDVADLHLLAMTHPAAKGERFMGTAGSLSVQEIAQLLKARLGNAAFRVQTRVLPNWVVWLASWFDPAVGLVLPELGKYRNATSQKARSVLDWEPRSAEDAIIAAAESLIELKLVKAAP